MAAHHVLAGLALADSRDVVPVLVEHLVPVRLSPGTDPAAWLDWWEGARADYGAAAVRADRAAARTAHEEYRRLVAGPKK